MKTIDSIVRILGSLRLTVVCLILAMFLVFIGTLAQVEMGLWEAQARFFRSLIVWWTPENGGLSFPVFPGGYLLGGLLLTNLISVLFVRFKYSADRTGILLTHLGLIVLLLGQLFTEMFQVESFMRLHEGQSKNYSESSREAELVFVDVTDADANRVVSIPDDTLASRPEVRTPALPFYFKVLQHHPNSRVTQLKPGETAAASQGTGLQAKLTPQPITADMNSRNLPSAVIEIMSDQNESQGTWLVSTWLNGIQELVHEGRVWEVALRLKRHYKPFSIELIDFRHDKYAGTEKPKNFSSQIRLRNDNTGEDREVLIYMNHPLRYQGETFYQASFDRADPTVTVLQVVRNPSWLIPYISCSLISLGLLIQFSIHLFKFLRPKKS